MNELPDHELLRRYAATGEEAPFTELVRRHLNLVWGAARRTTRDADAARDVAQGVFVDLARKAGHLTSATVLEGWLYRAACHAAAKHVRTESRRTQRERLAMQDPSLNRSHLADARATEVLEPELDAALAQLADGDRDALILRFLAGHSLAEVGDGWEPPRTPRRSVCLGRWREFGPIWKGVESRQWAERLRRHSQSLGLRQRRRGWWQEFQRQPWQVLQRVVRECWPHGP